jgi:hypothetical protein
VEDWDEVEDWYDNDVGDLDDRDDDRSERVRVVVPPSSPSPPASSDAIMRPRAHVAVPTVSVVMTTYNCAKYLEHAVRSLQAQTLVNWELVVVEDRSTDGTDTLLRTLAEEDDRIVYLHNQSNLGCYASKNLGIAHARGDWLTFHDADDYSMSDRLEKQLKYCLTGSIGDEGDRPYDDCYVTSVARQQKAWSMVPITLFLATRLFRDRLGSFDTVRFGADTEMYQRLHSLRLRVGIVDNYMYACPDRWIELDSRHTSLTGNRANDPIREKYRAALEAFHLPLQRALGTPNDEQTRRLRYPFPPTVHDDATYGATRSAPFPLSGLTPDEATRLFPSLSDILATLRHNSAGEKKRR